MRARHLLGAAAALAAVVGLSGQGLAATSYALKSLGSGDTTTDWLPWGSSGTWNPTGIPGADPGDTATLPHRTSTFGGINGVLLVDLGANAYQIDKLVISNSASSSRSYALDNGKLTLNTVETTGNGARTARADLVLAAAGSVLDFNWLGTHTNTSALLINGVIGDGSGGGAFDVNFTGNATGTGSYWRLGGHNTYTGDTTITDTEVRVLNTGSLLMDVNSVGDSSAVLGTGKVTMDGILRLDVGGVTAIGDWTLMSPTLTVSYGATFAVQLADGTPFTESSPGVWTLAANDCEYAFREATGVLSVPVFTPDVAAIPEPATLALLGLGGLGLVARRRRP